MVTKMHKKRIKTEPGNYFEFGFCFTCRVKMIPMSAPEKSFCFVPLVPFGGHSHCGF
jgi:hypothetical protein